MGLFSEVTSITCNKDYKPCTQHVTQYMLCAQHGYTETIWICCIIDMGPTLDVRYEHVLYIHTYIHIYIHLYKYAYARTYVAPTAKSWNGVPGVLPPYPFTLLSPL
jgi:hypothetical protein